MAHLDERAFASCYRHNSRALWSYLYRVTGKAADADDLVQDAFCRLLQADVGASVTKSCADTCSGSAAT